MGVAGGCVGAPVAEGWAGGCAEAAGGAYGLWMDVLAPGLHAEGAFGCKGASGATMECCTFSALRGSDAQT